MEWYWIVLIVAFALWLYFSIAVGLCAFLFDIADNVYKLDPFVGAFLGLIWPITSVLMFIMSCAFRVNEKNNSHE